MTKKARNGDDDDDDDDDDIKPNRATTRAAMFTQNKTGSTV